MKLSVLCKMTKRKKWHQSWISISTRAVLTYQSWTKEGRKKTLMNTNSMEHKRFYLRHSQLHVILKLTYRQRMEWLFHQRKLTTLITSSMTRIRQIIMKLMVVIKISIQSLSFQNLWLWTSSQAHNIIARTQVKSQKHYNRSQSRPCI